MLKKASPAQIGTFVVVAVVLLVAGLVVFGSGALMNETLDFVVYFEGSVKGLNVGAPVMFRGVKVGSVSDIRVTVNKDGAVSIPVYIDLELNRVRRMGDADTRQEAYAYIQRMVTEGLRAELELQSFVTGQLIVEFNFFPNEPIRLTRGETRVPELPTRASALQRLSRSVEQMPLEDIAQRTANAIDELVTLVQSPEFKGGTRDLILAMHDLRDLLAHANETVRPVIEDLQLTLKSLQDLVQQVNQRVDPLAEKMSKAADDTSKLLRTATDHIQVVAPKIDSAAAAAEQAFTNANQLMDAETGRASELVDSWRTAADSASDTMEQARHTLKTLEDVAGAGSPIHIELMQTIRELNKTAQALRAVADYLRRHPESLIHGRGKPERNP